MFYVLIGHVSGENFAHCELYRPHEYPAAYAQANRWCNYVGYNTVKIIPYATESEAILRMHQIEGQGW